MDSGAGRTRAVTVTVLSTVQATFKYCVQFWVPQFRKHIEVLELVHKRPVELVNCLEIKSCEQQQQRAGLAQPGEEKCGGDLITLCNYTPTL